MASTWTTFPSMLGMAIRHPPNLMETSFQGNARFEVQRCLGSGSFGSVYDVLDRERGLRVALKVPHDPQALNLLLFKQEFRSLTELSHPNLITLYELVSDGTFWCFTMELLKGRDLLSHLRGQEGSTGSSTLPSSQRSPYASSLRTLRVGETPQVLPKELLPPEPSHYSAPVDYGRVRRTFAQVAEGLLSLHRAGLLHRDLKPSNVMVTQDGRAVILDFGLATEGRVAEGMEDPAQVAGTLAYLAPEILEGVAANEATDWYALGVMLFQALTGCLPHTGNQVEMMRAKRDLDPCPLSLLIPGIPSDLEASCLRLLSRDPADRPQGPEALALFEPEGPRFSMPLPTFSDNLDLPGTRRSELDELFRALERSREGLPVVLQLHGPPGMGKSTLIRHFLREVRLRSSRSLALRARCYEQENMPFKAVDGLVDGLCHFLRRQKPSSLASLLPTSTAALVQLFPVLRQVGRAAELFEQAEAIPDRRELRARAFQAFREILARISTRRPVVLVIENLQWGDQDSVAMLLDLLRPPEAPHLLLVLTFPSEEEGDLPLLQGLEPGHTQEVRLALGPLSVPEARELATRMLDLGSEDAWSKADWVARQCQGSPFFLAELVEAIRNGRLQPTLPSEGLESHFRARVEALDPESRRLLELLAVAGHPMDWSALAAAAGLEGAADALLPRLRNEHFLRVHGSAQERKVVEPFHERMRHSLAWELSTERVQAHHAALAQALERLAPEQSQAMAFHFAAAGMFPEAAHHARIAAHQALGALAFDRAATLLEQAIGHLPLGDPGLPELWQQLGDALANAGRCKRSAEAYQNAARLLPPERHPRLLRRAAEELFRSGDLGEGVAILRPFMEAHGIASPTGRLETLARLVLARVRLAWRGFKCRIRSVEDLPIAQRERVDLLWALAMGLGPVDPLAAAYYQALGMRLALDLGEPFRIVRGLAHEVIFQALEGNRNLGKVRRVLETTALMAEAQGHPNPLGRLKVARGITAVLQGHWRVAAQLLEEAASLLQTRCTGLDYEVNIAEHQALLAHACMGNLATLAQRLPAVAQKARDRGNLLTLTNARVALGYLLCLARDQADLGLRDLGEAMVAWAQGEFQSIHYHHLVARVELELYRGHPGHARLFLKETWPSLRRSHLLRCQAIRITCLELRSRLAIARAVSAPPASLQRALALSRARKDLRAIREEHTPYGEALAFKLLACVRALEGNPAAAQDALRQAGEAFSRVDMNLHKAICELALGTWMGDRAMTEVAEAWMGAQGILKPRTWLSMHLPIFPIPV